MAKRSKKKKERSSEIIRTKEIYVSEISSVNPFTKHWKQLLQALVIVAAGLWIYGPVLYGDWLWDDDRYITANPLLHDPERLWKAWFEPGSWVEYYPIEESVQWIQWCLWGNDTLGYHLTNVSLHVISALLVWRLLSKFGLPLAWLGGLIFAIHPVMVESVAWISELKNTLSLPPFLLAMCAWIDYEQHKRKQDYFLALGLFVVAMLCKITMALFPVVILLYAWWKRSHLGWNDLKASTPFFVISLVLGMTTVWSGIEFAHLYKAFPDVAPVGGFFSRLALAGLTISFYFSKCFWPVGLLPIYPQWPVNPPSLWQFLPWPILGGVIYWLWRRRKGWERHGLLGLGFFLIILGPFVGFKEISYMSFTWVMDHFLYIPIIGLIGLVVAALGQMKEKLPATARPYGIGMVAIVMALLAWESHGYSGMFINEETLWTYTLEHNPEAWSAHNNLGKVLLQKGEVHEAMEQFEQALQIRPDYAEAHYNLSLALLQIGRVREAIEQCEQALRIIPFFVEAHNNLGNALFLTGRITEAIDQYEQALRIKSNYVDVHNNLGNALTKAGRITEAADQYEQALQINPNDIEAHYNLGNALFTTNRLAEAIDQYKQVLRINPDYVEAHINLGNALQQAGQFSEALGQYQEALKINPDQVLTHYNLAVVLVKSGQIPEAMDQYEQALRIKPDFTPARNALEQLQALQKAAPVKK